MDRMPSQEPAASTLSVGHVAAMSDTALVEFMRQHRGPDGNIVLPVDGWDKLSKDERALLAERLKAQERVLGQDPMLHSQPLDLDELDARLRAVSSDANNNSSRTRRRRLPNGQSRSPTPFVDIQGNARESEMEAYNKLVENGSRPLYSIALLYDVSRNPDEYSDLLRPWEGMLRHTGWLWEPASGFPTGYGPLENSHECSGHAWEVFGMQWARWQTFRIWQRDNRWIQDDDDGFPSYVEGRKNYMKRYPFLESSKKLPAVEADPSILRDEWWDLALWNRQKQRRLCREQHGGAEFADYVNAVKTRLASHGFTRPFELKEDPKQQDNLSTWIEYLNFEYWWLDRYTDTIHRLKPDYDKAWLELVDLNVLRPHETQEYVVTDKCLIRTQAEQDQAWGAWKKAQANAEQVYTSTQLDPDRLNIPKAERCRRLQAASHRLRTANAWLSSSKKRGKLICDFVGKTWDIRQAEKDATRHRILISWILKQVPLIEAESGQTNAIQHGPDTAKRAKKRSHPDEDSSWGEDSKKRKLSCSSLSLRSDTGAAVRVKSK